MFDDDLLLATDWQARLPQHSLRIGLSWPDCPQRAAGAARPTFAPLLSVPGVAFVCLQRAAPGLPGHADARGARLICLGDEIGGFDDVMAIVSQLDLLVTGDAAGAHLAHALGVPAWLLLPACDAPDAVDDAAASSIRVFRPRMAAHEAGRWTTALCEVAHALREWLAVRRATFDARVPAQHGHAAAFALSA